MKQRPFHLALALTIAGLGVGCGLLRRPTFNDYERNAGYIAITRRGLAAFVERHGTLPESLIQVCPSLAGEDCHWLPFGYRLTDAWQRPIRYRRLGDEYQLRSWGRDGRGDTSDDIVFQPSLERAMASRVGGCYLLAVSKGSASTEDSVRLDTQEVGTGVYAASPSLPANRPGLWSIIGRDSIVVAWYSIHESQQLRVGVHDDSLVGYTAIGPGLASWRGASTPRRRVVARKTRCAS